ncbi:FumA C-terminus/TtdB family hydratase beta subunit [Candidatus Omnitrophota bacterium]
MKKISTPLEKKQIAKLKAGEEVFLSGVIYTARDQAHKKIYERISRKKSLPLALHGQVIYYCGPTPAAKGRIIGSCGPTTSSRMDKFTPALLKAGLAAMIGKGRRSKEVIQAIKKNRAVYFLTLAGCGALLSEYVTAMKPVAYKDLGPEAIYCLAVKDFPLVVAVDSKGRSIIT